jgi:hypothetical protein
MQRWKLLSLVLVAVLGAGCQTMHQERVSSSLWDGSLGRILNNMAVRQDVTGLAELHCSGARACEFMSVNGAAMIDPESHKPTKEAMKASMIRYESTDADQNGAQYYVALPSGVSEVSVRFYPITADRAEVFTIIQDFRVDRTYRLHMYRHRNTGGGSLLSVAAPGPLCVDLIENEKVSRRFCRPYDPTTGMGEFVEQSLTSS